MLLPFAAKEPFVKNGGRVGETLVEVVVDVGVVDVETLVFSVTGRDVVEVVTMPPSPDPDPNPPEPLDGINPGLVGTFPISEPVVVDPVGTKPDPESIPSPLDVDMVGIDVVGELQAILTGKSPEENFIHWIWFSSAKDVALQLRVASSPLVTNRTDGLMVGTEKRRSIHTQCHMNDNF